MTRKLATIRTIDTITPIDGADRIEKATIDGWNIIVAKNQHQAGDQVIYVEIDAALPVRDHRLDPDGTLKARGTKRWNDTDCHILKTIRLRGTYSQGLILPITVLDEPTAPADALIRTLLPFPLLKAFKRAQRRLTAREGKDVARQLGITKYDPDTLATDGTPDPKGQPTNPNIVGPFPTQFARKSDSERVQNLAKYWDKITPHTWIATEKIDGQSTTLINDHGTLRIASRNYEIQNHPAKQWALDNDFLTRTAHGDAIQGEWAGPGVQGNKLDLDTPRFFAFAEFRNGTPTAHHGGWFNAHQVPTVYTIPPNTIDTPSDLLAKVDGMKSSINPNRLAEGIVFHESRGKELPTLGGRSTFKAISNKWLVKAK